MPLVFYKFFRADVTRCKIILQADYQRRTRLDENRRRVYLDLQPSDDVADMVHDYSMSQVNVRFGDCTAVEAGMVTGKPATATPC